MSEKRTVFQLWLVREYDNREDTELQIEIYETDADARLVIKELKSKVGFRDFPEGFKIEETVLGMTGWLEGFVTRFGPAPKNAESEAFDIPAWLND